MSISRHTCFASALLSLTVSCKTPANQNPAALQKDQSAALASEAQNELDSQNSEQGLGLLGMPSGKTLFNWYKRDTSGERSARVTGRTPPPPRQILPPNKPPVRTPPQCHDEEEAQPLRCAKLPAVSATDIIDQKAAIRLGKALFWDIQVGSDGQTACATCHYQAGADARTINTLHPGPDGVFQSNGVTAAGQNFRLRSIINDDRVGSQGVVNAEFLSIPSNVSTAKDNCNLKAEAPFGTQRAVTGRNTPTVIGAIYNVENFWDGRAHTKFNGFDPFGDTANAAQKTVLSTNASLASQAVGPVNNSVEMACAGRAFNGPNSVAAKLLSRPVLQYQAVSRTDSTLGSMSAFPRLGLRCGRNNCTYQELINTAFSGSIANDAVNNFSRIWGQAVMAYEATLIPDDTPMDRYLLGQYRALTPNQQRGLNIFNGKAHCYECHSGPELSDSSYTYLFREGPTNDDGADQGFHNLGVRPTEEDLGRAYAGPGGASFARSNSIYNRGAFKTPMLRNIKLTAPYFHNGGKATLEEVVDFYARGGDFANPELTSKLEKFSLGAQEKAQLVDFLRHGLTDCRVEKQRAPFDHPSLPLPNGPLLRETGAQGLGFCL